MNLTKHPLPTATKMQTKNNPMKTNLKFPIQSRHPLNLFAGTMLALLFFAPAILAGQGAASYVDWNSTTAGFGTPADTTETALTWSTSAAGTAATTAKPATTQLTIGANLADFAAVSPYAFNIDMNAGSTLQGILINSSNINVTLTGSSNEHNNSSPNTWTITNNSSLTLNDTRQAFDSASTVKGFNWNGVAVTFQGGGTFNFLTPFGCNTATAVQTENMIGGVINLQWPSTISTKSTSCGGFILTNGTLNFASAGSAYVFSGLTNGQTVSINGGTIDNTSGSPLTLVVATLSGNVGGRGYSFGGNFTFTGSSSLDLGTANVTNSVSPTITVSANTLAIGGVISGPGNGLTKIGNGTLQFYGANTYSGNTFVNRGTLALTNGGSIANSPLIVSNATFDVSGLSAATALTSLSISNSTLVIAGLSSTATNIMATTLNPGGTTNIINVTSLPQVTSYPATFHVFKGTTLNGTLNFGLGTLPSASPAFVGYITNRPATASVDLVLTTGPAPVRALTWTGTNAISGLPDGTWDVVTTPTWLDASSAATTFNQLDFVRFDDTAAGQTAVNLTTTLTPSSLIVSNNTLAYTFIGNHLADGSSSLTLTKQGTGTLLLQESGDSFSGNIAANGGTVIIDNDSSTITGGTVIGGSGTVQVGTNDTAGVLPSGTVTVNGALVFNRSDNITVANTISGSGTVSQINGNIVTLSGASSGSWATMITNGTLQAVNNTSLGSVPGGTVTVTNGGTFDVGGNTTQNNANFGSKPFVISGAGVGGNGAIINSGSVQQQNAFQSITVATDATWGGANRWDMRGGTPQLNLAGHTLTKTSGNQISLVSPHVTSGNIVIQQGILSFETTPTFDASAGTITVNPGGYLAQYRDTAGSYTRSIVLNGGGTTNISGAGQTAILDATITLTANSTIGSSGGTEFFNGVISDGGNGFSVAIVGTGTNIFAATNTFTGITSVQGVAGLTNRGSLASSAVIVITNTGVFDVSGMTIPFSGANALWVGDDTMGQGTFKLGKTLVTNFNYLSISNAVLEMAVINPNVPCITVTNLNLGDNGAGSTINVTALPVPAPAQFPLIKYANATGTYNLSIGTLPAGYSGNLFYNTANNSIDLVITGLPSEFGTAAVPLTTTGATLATGTTPLSRAPIR